MEKIDIRHDCNFKEFDKYTFHVIATLSTSLSQINMFFRYIEIDIYRDVHTIK